LLTVKTEELRDMQDNYSYDDLNLASVVLLAGNSKRMGEPKQHVVFEGKTFLRHIIEKLTDNQSYFDKMIFVGQQFDFQSQNLVKEIGGIWVNNVNPEQGPLSSIKLAINLLDDSYAILLWPTDHPMIQTQTVRMILKAWKAKQNFITVPSDGQRRGHPTVFPNWACSELLKTPLSLGAKSVLANNPDKISHIMTEDPWIRVNFNTPEILRTHSVCS
jgi:molybdenum cofactor cytidylyltransferase